MRGVGVFAVIVLLVALTDWQSVLSGFRRVSGDSYDSLIELSILEHWVNVFRMVEPWHTTLYFFPYRETLAYNDGYFLFGVIYAPLRLLRLPVFVSAELTHCTVWIVGALALYSVLRSVFSMRPGWALLSICLFLFSPAYGAQAVHEQLSTVAFIPILVWFIARSVVAEQERRRYAALGWGVAASLFLNAWLLTSFYTAWFMLLFAVAALPIHLLTCGAEERQKLWALLRSYGLRAALILLVLGLGAIPFLWLYIPKLHETTLHPFGEVVTGMPRVTDILNTGPDNVLSGGLVKQLHRVFPALFPLEGERVAGVSPLLVLAFLTATVWCWTTGPFRGRSLSRTMTVTVIATWLLTLHFGAWTPWWYIFAWVPGAQAIRVVVRYQLILVLPIVAVVGIALSRWSARLPRWAVVAAVLLVAGQSNASRPGRMAADLGRFDRAAWQPPPQCRVFFTEGAQRPPQTEAETSEAPLRHNVDAMLIAELIGLPTISGFSTFNPPLWNFANAERPDYRWHVAAYAKEFDLHGLCALDLRTKAWTADTAPPALKPIPLGQMIAVGGDYPAATLFGPGWYPPEPWGAFTQGTLAMLLLPLPSAPKTPLTLSVTVHPIPRPGGALRTVTVMLDDQRLAVWTMGRRDPETFTATIPARSNPASVAIIRFVIDHPDRPRDLGMGDDTRLVGFGLMNFTVSAAS